MGKVLGVCIAGLFPVLLMSAAVATDYPALMIPDACGVQLKTHNNDSASLDRVAELGLKFVRRGFIWASVEKKKGEYDFSEYDRLVKDCEERGLYILGCIALGNPIYSHVRTPEGRDAYATYAAKLAERYKGKKIIWELWNEPNIATFWGKHGTHNSPEYAQEYYELVKATVPLMKQADPDCKVMAGSVSGVWSASRNWMISIFKLGVLSTGIDAWSVHPYTTKKPEGYIENYEWIRKMMKKQGNVEPLPLINSERGYPLGKAEGFAGGDAAMSKEYQAWHLVRQYIIDQLCGVLMTCWYEWSGKEGFSLYSAEEELPAYKACRVMLAELEGYRVEGRLPLASEDDFAVVFVNGKGGVKIAVWASPPGEESPDKTVEHEVEIPVEATGELQVCGIYGEKSSVKSTDGKISIRLSGAPQYITVK